MLIVLARHSSAKNSSYHRKNTFVLHAQYQSVSCLVKSICCSVAFPKFFCNVGCCPYSFIKSHSSGIQSCTLVAFLPERPKLYHTRSKKKTPCQNCVSFRTVHRKYQSDRVFSSILKFYLLLFPCIWSSSSSARMASGVNELFSHQFTRATTTVMIVVTS